MFWGREDVYAKRGKNGGYFPQCANRWNDHLCPKQQNQKIFCDECINKKWTRLDVKRLLIIYFRTCISRKYNYNMIYFVVEICNVREKTIRKW